MTKEVKNVDTNELKTFFQDSNIIHLQRNAEGDLDAIPTNICYDNGVYTVYADLCGVKKEDISLQLNGNTLKISAQRHLPKSDAFHKSEINVGYLLKLVNLESEIDIENIKSTFSNGLLTIELPKNTKNECINIEIN